MNGSMFTLVACNRSVERAVVAYVFYYTCEYTCMQTTATSITLLLYAQIISSTLVVNSATRAIKNKVGCLKLHTHTTQWIQYHHPPPPDYFINYGRGDINTYHYKNLAKSWNDLHTVSVQRLANCSVVSRLGSDSCFQCHFLRQVNEF